MTEIERFKAVRIAKEMDQKEFGDLLKLHQGSVSDIERGKVQKLSIKVKEALQRIGVNPNYMATGEEPMFLNAQKTKAPVPVYEIDFFAGGSLPFGDVENHVIGYVEIEGFKRCNAFVRVKGNSMYPDFVPGDFIGLEPITDKEIIEYGQPYAIETKSEQRYLKFIRRGVDNHNLVLRSANIKDHDDIDIPKDKIRYLWKVHGPIRDQWQ